MTDLCKGERAEFEAESYVRGALPEDAAAAFEEHFFACDPCLHHVEALQLVERVLKPSASKLPSSVPQKRPRSQWTVLFGAAAAAIVITVAGIGIVGVLRNHFQSQSATVHPQSSMAPVPSAGQAPAKPEATPATPDEVQIAELAEPTLPPYVAHTLRGEEQIDSSFDKGMTAYSAKDCATAVQELDRVSTASSDAKAARLYSGACHLRLRELDTARRELEAVVEAGDSPQQETAIYLLAQVELASGHSVKAKQLLERTVSLQGDYERRAKSQLKRLANIKVVER